MLDCERRVTGDDVNAPNFSFWPVSAGRRLIALDPLLTSLTVGYRDSEKYSIPFASPTPRDFTRMYRKFCQVRKTGAGSPAPATRLCTTILWAGG
jgi:hypothetical protein